MNLDDYRRQQAMAAQQASHHQGPVPGPVPPPPAANREPPANGNLLYQQALQSYDPLMFARLTAFARNLGKEINWDLPLEGATMAQWTGPRTNDTGVPLEIPLTYRFPLAGYITRVTGEIVGPDFGQYEPYNGADPFSFVALGWTQRTNLNYTASNEGLYVPARSIVGTAQRPYELDLVQTYMQGDTASIQVRVSPRMIAFDNLAICFHYLLLPLGVALR